MPEETPTPSDSSQKSSAAPAESPKTSPSSASRTAKGQSSFLTQGIQGKILATIKVQGAKLLRDAGAGLLSYGNWLQDRTTESDAAKAEAVERSTLERFGQLWQRWSDVLSQLRSRLPKKLGSSLTDSRLTGLLVGILVFLWVALSSGSSGKEAPRNVAGTIDRSTQPQPVRQRPKSTQPTVTSRPYEGPPRSSQSAEPPLEVATDVATDIDPVPEVSSETPSEISASQEEEVVAPVQEEEVSAPIIAPFPGMVPVTEWVEESPELVAESVPSDVEAVGRDRQSATSPLMESVTPQEDSQPQAVTSLAAADSDEASASDAVDSPEDTSHPEPSVSDRAIASDTEIAPTPLSPEQKLTARIRSQLDEATDNPELISSLQTNFGQGELLLKLRSTWYELPYAEQDSIMDAFRSQAKAFDFTTLRILDEQNRVLARKPVIGDGMIIVKRRP